MTRPPALLAALLRLTVILAGPAVLAQPTFLGEPIPLTNPTHAPATGSVHFIAGAHEPAFLWIRGDTVRLARLRDGRLLVAADFLRIDTYSSPRPSAIRVGEHWLVAHRVSRDGPLVTQLLDARGSRIGPAHVIEPDGYAPKLVTNGRVVLLVYAVSSNGYIEYYVRRLNEDGAPAPGEAVKLQGYGSNPVVTENGFAAVTQNGGDIIVTTFDATGERTKETVLHATGSIQNLAAASDGKRILIAIADWSADGLYGCAVDADGTIGSPQFIAATDALSMFAGSVVWSESDWIVSYQTSYPTIHGVVHVDRDGKRLLLHKVIHARALAIGAASDGAYAAITDENFELSIRKLSLAENVSVPLPPVSSDQWLLGSAYSPEHGAFAVWRDGGVTRSGVRSPDGQWTEQTIEIPAGEGGVKRGVSEWMFVYASEGTSHAQRFGAQGEPLGDPIRLPDYADDITRLGSTWVATRQGRVFPFSSLGPVWTPPDWTTNIGHSSIETDGNRFLVAWSVREPYPCSGNCPGWGIQAALLSSDLRLVRGPFRLSDEGGREEGPVVTWNGVEYVVRWDGDQAAYVSPQGMWRRTVETAMPIVFDEHRGESPYYGARRVMMRVPSPTPLPPKPAAPVATGFVLNGSFLIEWLGPPQPVNGYRVEYRTHDGPWTELAALQTATHVVFTPPDISDMTTFRVRASNEAGLGAYSNSVVINSPRRKPAR